jgi:hypothetical protein
VPDPVDEVSKYSLLVHYHRLHTHTTPDNLLPALCSLHHTMPPKSTATTKAKSAGQAKLKKVSEAQKRKAKNSGKATPVGSYLVTCETIEEEWPDDVGEEGMVLDIREAGQKGVYEASFDFGMAEGAMVLSSDTEALKAHINRLDKHNWYKGADEDAKKAKAASTTSARKLFLACRGCETGEGQIHSMPSNGTMSFDAKFASFSGTFGFAHIGEDVPFILRHITSMYPTAFPHYE